MNNETKKKIRLFVSSPLREGTELLLPEASSHYLCNVMRLQNGQTVYLMEASDTTVSEPSPELFTLPDGTALSAAAD